MVQAQDRSEKNGLTDSRAFGHQAWSSENGLPQNSLHQILQTRDGYLWIATEGGVARFNGSQFTTFNRETDQAITSNDTCCLTEDRSGALWIGTSDGLLRYTRGAFQRYTTTDGLPSPVIQSLAPAADGSFLVLTSGGLARYDGGKFTPLANGVIALGVGPARKVWLATATGIFSYSEKHLRAPFPVSTTEPIEGLGSLQDGSKWVRTRTALLLWNRGHLRTWRTGHELPGTRVQSVLADFRGTLWVGTDTAGLDIFRQQNFQTLPSLSGHPITSITQTKDGTIWLGSEGEGLFRYKGGETHLLSTKDGLILAFPIV